MIEKELYKDRGYTGCLHAALGLLSGNFGTIVRKTWPSVLAYSLLLGVMVLPIPLFVKLPLLALCFVAECWVCGDVTTLVNDLGRKRNFMHSLRLLLVNVGVYVAFGLLFVAMSVGLLKLTGASLSPEDVKGTAALALVALVFLVAFIIYCVPLVFANAKYMLEPGAKLRGVLTDYYKQGRRGWAFLFVVGILVALIECVAIVIAAFPCIIMNAAMQANAMGVLAGDPWALPAYFPLLSFAIQTAVAFITAYVSVWMLFVAYYAYGRIEARRMEMEEQRELQTME